MAWRIVSLWSLYFFVFLMLLPRFFFCLVVDWVSSSDVWCGCGTFVRCFWFLSVYCVVRIWFGVLTLLFVRSVHTYLRVLHCDCCEVCYSEMWVPEIKSPILHSRSSPYYFFKLNLCGRKFTKSHFGSLRPF